MKTDLFQKKYRPSMKGDAAIHSEETLLNYHMVTKGSVS